MLHKTVIINTDGGSRGNPGKAASAFVVQDLDGHVLFQEGVFLGIKTNNEAEYQGVIAACQWAIENYQDLQIEKINFILDSELVVKQLRGEYKIKNLNLLQLAQQIKALEKVLIGVEISYQNVPREENKLADLLVNQTLDEHGKVQSST